MAFKIILEVASDLLLRAWIQTIISPYFQNFYFKRWFLFFYRKSHIERMKLTLFLLKFNQKSFFTSYFVKRCIFIYNNLENLNPQ
jgi:hypothetical protein